MIKRLILCALLLMAATRPARAAPVNATFGNLTNKGNLSLTGTQANGNDQVSGAVINGVVDVSAYGASGSAQTTTGSTTAGSATVTLSSALDFKAGQGVLVFGAGPAPLYGTPSAPTVTTVGTAGSTSVCYKVAQIDYWGGVSVASGATCVTNAQSSPTTVNYEKIVTSGFGGYAGAIVYRSISSATYTPISILALGNATLDDVNLNTLTGIAVGTLIPSLPPTAAQNQWWVATISSGAGTTSLTMNATAPSGVSNAIVWHDDTQAIQTAINNNAGKLLTFGPGTFNVNNVSYWNNTTWVYTNPTTPPTATEVFGMVHLKSNTTLRGTSAATTTLASLGFASVYHAILAAANPTATLISGGICNTGGETTLTKYAIANITRGSSIVHLSTQANVLNFATGDLIRFGGGINDAQVSCGASNPTAENNIVVSMDANNGYLHLAYPASKDVPYGTAGTANFVEKINTVAFSNVDISNMTLATQGGGQALGVGDIIHLRVSHVNIPLITWSGSVNMNELQDAIFDDMNWLSTGSEEFDQIRNVTIQNSTLILKSGYKAFITSEGGSGFHLIHNTITTDDLFCGYAGRCDLGGNVTIGLDPGGEDFRIVNNWIAGTSTNSLTAILMDAPDTGLPTPWGLFVEGNTFRLTSSAAATVTQFLSPVKEEEISGNTMYFSGATTNSWGIGTFTGIVSHNYLFEANDKAGQGIIRVSLPANETDPLLISDNNIIAPTGDTADTCIYVAGAFTHPSIVVKNNYCLNANQGIYFVSGAPSGQIVNNFTQGVAAANILVPAIAISSCGATLTANAGSTNTAGSVTAGLGVTACTVTLAAGGFPNYAFCTAIDQTRTSALQISAQSRTAFTVSGITASDTFSYQCWGS